MSLRCQRSHRLVKTLPLALISRPLCRYREGFFYQGHTTNNIAEYDGMIQGMRAAVAAGIKSLRVRGDSNLAIQQMQVRQMSKTIEPFS